MKQRASRNESKAAWLVRGPVRRVVAALLSEPITGREVTEAIYRSFPGIDQPQVVRILHELTEKGLVRCLNPHVKKDMLFSLTSEGRSAVAEISNLNITPPVEKDKEWNIMASVRRSMIRRAIMIQLWKHRSEWPAIACQIRRWISNYHLVHRARFYMAMKRLVVDGLLRDLGPTLTGKHRLYVMTKKGRKVGARLVKEM